MILKYSKNYFRFYLFIYLPKVHSTVTFKKRVLDVCNFVCKFAP
jgi:hypothetical protein